LVVVPLVPLWATLGLVTYQSNAVAGRATFKDYFSGARYWIPSAIVFVPCLVPVAVATVAIAAVFRLSELAIDLLHVGLMLPLVYFIALPAWLAIINQRKKPFDAVAAALRYSMSSFLQLLGLSLVCAGIVLVSAVPLGLLLPFAA